MKLRNSDYRRLKTKVSLKNSAIAVVVLVIGLLLTAVSVYHTKINIKKTVVQDFEYTINHLQTKMDSRIRINGQILRSGAALFDVSDTVTRESWKKFYNNQRLEIHFPGIQGYGYSEIIKPDELEKHIEWYRSNGFPDYNVTPEGGREIYTSIVYLEPFSGRNLRAFGYDMFSEPVRRKAMEAARDSNYAVLSGKVTLVQETEEDIQAGALMYVPVYKKNMPVNTVEERRAAIRGWVYSPYRIQNLTSGILGDWDLPGKNRIHLIIYDGDDISAESLIYDSQSEELMTVRPNLHGILPVTFNDKVWTMVFDKRSRELTLFQGDLLIVLTSGIIISLLLFFLTLALIRTNIHAKQIIRLNKKLEKHNSDKDRFLSILGHDLKNPFNSMLGFLSILTKDFQLLEKDKIETYISHVHTATKNTYKLLEDLLEWTRVQSGNMPFEPKLHEIHSICMHVHNQLKPDANAKNIRINCFNDTGTKVFADIDMLKTILRNLISNAVKFTNYGGEINIEANEDSKQTLISVADNGVGIDPDDMKKLFVISQINTTKGTENEGGTGLGLILCKEFIDIHGGEILVESKPDKGSKFTVIFPNMEYAKTLKETNLQNAES